jgi:hypothetical protein
VVDDVGTAGAAAVASSIRRDREQLVAELSDGTVGLAALVGPAADPRAGQVKVVRLAEAVPGVGKVLSRRVLEELGVSPGVRWGELTPTAALAVVRALEQAATRSSDRPPAGDA